MSLKPVRTVLILWDHGCLVIVYLDGFLMFLYTLNPVLDYPDAPFSEWCNQSIHNLEVMPQSKYSGVSGCSDAVSQGSGGSTRSTELVLGEKFLQKSDQKFNLKHFVLYRLSFILCLCMLYFRQGWKTFQKMPQPAVFFWGRRCFGWSLTWAPQWGLKGMKLDSSRKETINLQGFQFNKCFPNKFPN